MCGIVGVIKREGCPVTRQEFEDFLTILVEAENRGKQATGVIYVFENGDTFCMKTPATANLAVDFMPYRENVRALLGHTRQSTGGYPRDNENNHPHETLNWALIHNGTCWTTVPDKDLDLRTKCDTEEFVRTFEYVSRKEADGSIENVLIKSFDKMNGSWSLAFVNKKSSDIFLTTNGKSPLNCVYFPDGMYFASMALYLDSIDRYDTSVEEDRGIFLGMSIKDSIGLVKTVGEDQIFEPEKLKIFKVNPMGRLDVFCEYADKAFQTRYQGRNATAWDDDEYLCGYGSGYNSDFVHGRRNESLNKVADKAAKVDLDLLTEEEWVVATKGLAPTEKCKTEAELFEHYSAQLDFLQVDFDVDLLDFRLELDLTTDVVEKLALYLLELDPKTYGLNYGQVYNLVKLMKDETWLKPPEAIMKAIKAKFNTQFIQDLIKHTDTQNYPAMPDYVWSLIDDDRSAADIILDYTSWEIQVLVITFGVAFDDANADFGDKDVWGEDLYRPALMEDEPDEDLDEKEIPDSKYACTSCLIKRKVMTGNHGEERHVCNRCGTVIIIHPTMKRVN